MSADDVSALTRQVAELTKELARLTQRQAATDKTSALLADGMDAMEEAVQKAAALATELSSDDATIDELPTPLARPEPLELEALIEWVDNNLGLIVQRRVIQAGGSNGVRWCATWWKHPEAIARFQALHQAWEYFVTQTGPAMGTYFREFFDPCLRELFDAAGPFSQCSPDSHQDSQPLGVAAERPNDEAGTPTLVSNSAQ